MKESGVGWGPPRPSDGWGHCSACLTMAAVTLVSSVDSPSNFWGLTQALFSLTTVPNTSCHWEKGSLVLGDF